MFAPRGAERWPRLAAKVAIAGEPEVAAIAGRAGSPGRRGVSRHAEAPRVPHRAAVRAGAFAEHAPPGIRPPDLGRL